MSVRKRPKTRRNALSRPLCSPTSETASSTLLWCTVVIRLVFLPSIGSFRINMYIIPWWHAGRKVSSNGRQEHGQNQEWTPPLPFSSQAWPESPEGACIMTTVGLKIKRRNPWNLNQYGGKRNDIAWSGCSQGIEQIEISKYIGWKCGPESINMWWHAPMRL